MKTTVPCKITYSEEDKCWYVESPGFYDGIMTDGPTLEQAKEMAAEAVCGLIETYLEHNIPFSIPPMNNAPDYYAIPLEPGLSFALWLRNQRKSHNMSLADVAKKMGVKYQVYQKLENPHTANPTLKTLYKIEQIFGNEVVAL
ncbi:MAG: type II toxin-antitoxin system HicB family antitoxin [Treponema sp.]|jgi:antitoxin HicB|nr:type II toxin-antitoxin system HicB family antitoxin [Treponema sp.]